MNSFEFNKIAGGILFSVLILLVIGQLTSILMSPTILEKVAYPVPAIEAPAASAKADAEDQPSLGALLAEADAESGKKAARKCTACHTFDQGGANRVGPNLYGILNDDVARTAGFSYSAALKDRDGGWTFEVLDAFIANPRAAMPGTRMAFAGIRRAGERADLLLYMRSLGDADAELPAAE